MSKASITFLVLAFLAGLAVFGVALHETLPEWLVGSLIVGVAAIVGGVYAYSMRTR